MQSVVCKKHQRVNSSIRRIKTLHWFVSMKALKIRESIPASEGLRPYKMKGVSKMTYQRVNSSIRRIKTRDLRGYLQQPDKIRESIPASEGLRPLACQLYSLEHQNQRVNSSIRRIKTENLAPRTLLPTTSESQFQHQKD